MKKLLLFILLLITFVGYIENEEDYSNQSVLNYNIEYTVFEPVKNTCISVHKSLITDDFKIYTKLALENAFYATKTLFLNILNSTFKCIFRVDNNLESSNIL